jgi:hypothetical protein
VSDLHVRLLRRVARQARGRLSAHRSGAAAPATEREAETGRHLEQAAIAADTRLSQSMERRRRPAAEEHSIGELDALAAHARQRLALYRRRIYLGRGQDTKLAELERISAGAQERAQRARRGRRTSPVSPTQPKDRRDEEF